MKILIDIGHPGHVHLFKHFAHRMIKNGHRVHFTVRDKEFEIQLLQHEGFEYSNFGKHYKSISGKLFGMFRFTLKMILVSLKFKPDIFISHGSVYTAFASFFLRIPNIALEDTGNAEQVILYKPFTKAILTSRSFLKNYGKKQLYYNSYHELAYLHPDLFNPDPDILMELGIGELEKYFILRFVSWSATHDSGHGGMTLEEKKQLIDVLKSYGKVFISSENQLQPEFEPFRFNLQPWKMHDALNYATLFIGEGATMASECAMLGTPAVYINSIQAGSINEQERLGLLFHFNNGKGVAEKIQELLKDRSLKNTFLVKRNTMLSEKINLTSLLIWFVENYPGSISEMKNNQDFQNKFKKIFSFL